MQYYYYRRLLATLNSAREKALEETNKSRKRKRAELIANEKRDVVAIRLWTTLVLLIMAG